MSMNNIVFMRQATGLSDEQLLDRIVFTSLYGESITKTKAARILKRSRQTIYNMIADGRLKTTRDGLVSGRSLWAYTAGVEGGAL